MIGMRRYWLRPSPVAVLGAASTRSRLMSAIAAVVHRRGLRPSTAGTVSSMLPVTGTARITLRMSVVLAHGEGGLGVPVLAGDDYGRQHQKEAHHGDDEHRRARG